jgi:hypothetical protein
MVCAIVPVHKCPSAVRPYDLKPLARARRGVENHRVHRMREEQPPLPESSGPAEVAKAKLKGEEVQELCEKISVEQDPKKLQALIAELSRAWRRGKSVSGAIVPDWTSVRYFRLQEGLSFVVNRPTPL